MKFKCNQTAAQTPSINPSYNKNIELIKTIRFIAMFYCFFTKNKALKKKNQSIFLDQTSLIYVQ